MTRRIYSTRDGTARRRTCFPQRSRSRRTQPQFHYLLGRSYYEMADYSRSITSLERAVELANANSQYHDWLGKAYGFKAEETQSLMFWSALSYARKAHHEFELAVQYDPGNLEAQRDLIQYLTNAPDFAGGGDDKALAQIDALTKVDPIEAQLARAQYWVYKKNFAGGGQAVQSRSERRAEVGSASTSKWRTITATKAMPRTWRLRSRRE